MNELKLVIDIAIEKEELSEYVADMKRRFDIDVEILNEEGPGGGNPEVLIHGTEEMIKLYFVEYNGEWDKDEFESFVRFHQQL